MPARTSAQRRFHTKNMFVYHALCAGILTMDAPLWGDTGGHTGAVPTHLHQTTRCGITSSHCTFDSLRQSHGVFIPHRIAHSIAPNHGVCHYPIGVILLIAQGWQVQRSLPWVMVQARRLPPWGLYFFSSHTITTRSEQMVSRTQIDFKKYNADGIGPPPTTLPRVASYRRQPWAGKSTSPTGLISPHPFTHEDLMMDAPLGGDAGGHIGTAPTNLRNIFPRNPIQTK